MDKNSYSRLSDVSPVENEHIPGHFRSTLAYNDEIMLCHFSVKKGATVELHNHEAAQIGYVLSGKVSFFNEEGILYTATAGDSYVFKSMEFHGCTAEEDCTFIECFSPIREEYKIK